MSPRASDCVDGRQSGRQDTKKHSGSIIIGGIEKTERGIPGKKLDIPAVGDGFTSHGRRSPAAERGRKAMEESFQGGGGSPRNMREEAGAGEQGRTSPGAGTPLANIEKQDLSTQNKDVLEHVEANGGTLEDIQCTETISRGRGEDPALNIGSAEVQSSQILVEVDSGQHQPEYNQALMCNQRNPQYGGKKVSGVERTGWKPGKGHLGNIKGPPHKK